MTNSIFGIVNSRVDSDWVVKEFFNSLYYAREFLWALPLILEKKGCSVNEAHCSFPDLNDPDPECHFSGVKISLMDDEITLTFDELLKFLRQACVNYVQLHPEHGEQVADLLTKVS